MTVYIRGLEGKLNDILTILGTTTPQLFPFWEPTGQLVTGIGIGDLVPRETAGAAEDLEHDYAPLKLPCGLYSYHFHPTGDHHLAGIDHADYSFAGTGGMSLGAWIRPNTVTNNCIMAKYDVAGTDREYRLWLDAASKLDFEMYDDTANATEIAISAAADITKGHMQFVCATYDGTAATPTVYLYVNGVAVNDGTTVETGLFVDFIPGATPLTVGCSGVTATPTFEFHGRIALPFITGKALTAANVSDLYKITAPMVGIA